MKDASPRFRWVDFAMGSLKVSMVPTNLLPGRAPILRTRLITFFGGQTPPSEQDVECGGSICDPTWPDKAIGDQQLRSLKLFAAFRPLLSNERGSILTITALTAMLLLSVLGFAIDVGHMWIVRRDLQSAADAAALAAVLEARTCGSLTNCQVMQTAAEAALTENGFTATTVLTNCSGSQGSGVTLVLNNPPCSISTDPNLGKTNFAEAIVSQPVSTYFAALAGVRTVTVSARAEAARGVGGPCIYALDPNGAGITIVAGVIVKSRCPVIYESVSSNALSCILGVFLYAPRVSISGGTSGLLCGVTSTPQTHVPAPNPRDPLAYLSAPSTANDPCGSSSSSPYYGSSQAVNVALAGNVVFNPGVYCGGISLTAALLSNVKFNPGTYILRDKTNILGLTSGGLNLTLNTLTNVTGNGVTFYNEGPQGGFSVAQPVSGGSLVSLSNISLSAPTSGNYAGILFFQAHGVNSSGLFLANLASSSKLEGAIYLPDGSLNYGVGALSSAYNILVAKYINLLATVASSFGDDYSSLSGGSPLNGDNATLVQ